MSLNGSSILSVLMLGNLYLVQKECSSKADTCPISDFCGTMQTHLFVISFLIILTEIQEILIDFDNEDNAVAKLLEFLITFSGFLYFNSFVFYLYNYLRTEFFQEMDDQCYPIFALNFSTFYFLAYFLFFLMFIFILIVTICVHLSIEQQAANMQKEMKHIFEKIYLDPEAIKNFYLKYGE